MRTMKTTLQSIARIALTAAATGVLALAGLNPASADTADQPVAIQTVSSTQRLTDVFGDSVQLNRVVVDTELGLTGSVNQTWEFTVATDQANATNGELQTYLSPDPNVGTISSSEESGQTTYTVTLSGSDVVDFNTKLGSYIPGAYFLLEKPYGFYIWPGYNVRMYLPVTDTKLSGGVDGTYTYTLKLPFLNSFDVSSQSLVSQGVIVSGDTVSATQTTMQGVDITGHIYLAAAGPNLVSLIVLGVILLLLIGILVLLIKNRQKIKSYSQKLWSRLEKVIAATSTGVEAATAAAKTGVGAATEAARHAGSSIKTMRDDFQKTNQSLLSTEIQPQAAQPQPAQQAWTSQAAGAPTDDAPTGPLAQPAVQPAAQEPVIPQGAPDVQPAPAAQPTLQQPTLQQPAYAAPGVQPVAAQPQGAYPYGAAPQVPVQQPARQITPEVARWQQDFNEHYMQ